MRPQELKRKLAKKMKKLERAWERTSPECALKRDRLLRAGINLGRKIEKI